MPFQSTKQLRTCFSKEISAKSQGKPYGWNCRKWLKETPDPACLPGKKGGSPPKKCRRIYAGEKVVGKIHIGPRGGHYFFAAGVKVYVPPGSAALKTARRMYGSA
jgi:hypothetical protein